MVAALVLHAEGLVGKLAILDLDMHYGNGTDDIVAELGIDWIVHYTQGKNFHARSQVGSGAERYFAWLRKAIDACQKADPVALVVLVLMAGAAVADCSHRRPFRPAPSATRAGEP